MSERTRLRLRRGSPLHGSRPDTRIVVGRDPPGPRGTDGDGRVRERPRGRALRGGVRRRDRRGPVRRDVERTRRAAYRADRGGPRARRGGDRSGDDLRRDARGRDAGRRRPGRRRHPGGRLQPRPGRRGCGDHGPHAIRPSRPSLRAARRHAPARVARPPAHRGRLPGAGRRPGRASRRDGRARRGVQLLPGEEPRRHGGRRSARHRQRRACRSRRSRCESTGSAGSTSTTRRDSPPASTRCRRSSCSASCRCSSAGTTSGGAIATRYLEALEGVGDLRLPPVPAGSEPVWHLFVVRTAEPDLLAAHLAERGVQSGRHYPLPVHLTEAYAYLGLAEGSFPVAEALARQCLSLPIFPGMREDEVEHVVAAVKAFFDHG